ncbi:MAG: hypothetical protein WBG53_01630 [Rhodococcus sp. (in: high G+C Gram-positive bacteria)]
MNLYWQPGVIDFANTGDVELFYSSAIVAAGSSEELNQWVSRDALLPRWDELSLPTRVRRAWETVHPILRSQDTAGPKRLSIQDSVIESVAQSALTLGNGSTLIDYDVVGLHGNGAHVSDNRWDPDSLITASQRVFDVCCASNWRAVIVENTDYYTRILIDAGSGPPVIVQMVLASKSNAFVPSSGHGLRLMFHDVVGEKVAAVADFARGRNFFDLAHILDTPGWNMKSAEDAMCRVGSFDRVNELRTNVDRFRQGHFDDKIRRSGFDVRFCHHVLDHD